jgi:hypothetical protein
MELNIPTITIRGFGGLDTRPNMLGKDPRDLAAAQNVIVKDGVIWKRPGLKRRIRTQIPVFGSDPSRLEENYLQLGFLWQQSTGGVQTTQYSETWESLTDGTDITGYDSWVKIVETAPGDVNKVLTTLVPNGAKAVRTVLGGSGAHAAYNRRLLTSTLNVYEASWLYKFPTGLDSSWHQEFIAASGGDLPANNLWNVKVQFKDASSADVVVIDASNFAGTVVKTIPSNTTHTFYVKAQQNEWTLSINGEVVYSGQTGGGELISLKATTYGAQRVRDTNPLPIGLNNPGGTNTILVVLISILGERDWGYFPRVSAVTYGGYGLTRLGRFQEEFTQTMDRDPWYQTTIVGTSSSFSFWGLTPIPVYQTTKTDPLPNAYKDRNGDYEIWYLVNPPTGNHSIIPTLTPMPGDPASQGASFILEAAVFSGVNQTSPFRTGQPLVSTIKSDDSTTLNGGSVFGVTNLTLNGDKNLGTLTWSLPSLPVGLMGDAGFFTFVRGRCLRSGEVTVTTYAYSDSSWSHAPTSEVYPDQVNGTYDESETAKASPWMTTIIPGAELASEKASYVGNLRSFSSPDPTPLTWVYKDGWNDDETLRLHPTCTFGVVLTPSGTPTSAGNLDRLIIGGKTTTAPDTLGAFDDIKLTAYATATTQTKAFVVQGGMGGSIPRLLMADAMNADSDWTSLGSIAGTSDTSVFAVQFKDAYYFPTVPPAATPKRLKVVAGSFNVATMGGAPQNFPCAVGFNRMLLSGIEQGRVQFSAIDNAESYVSTDTLSLPNFLYTPSALADLGGLCVVTTEQGVHAVQGFGRTTLRTDVLDPYVGTGDFSAIAGDTFNQYFLGYMGPRRLVNVPGQNPYDGVYQVSRSGLVKRISDKINNSMLFGGTFPYLVGPLPSTLGLWRGTRDEVWMAYDGHTQWLYVLAPRHHPSKIGTGQMLWVRNEDGEWFLWTFGTSHALSFVYPYGVAASPSNQLGHQVWAGGYGGNNWRYLYFFDAESAKDEPNAGFLSYFETPWIEIPPPSNTDAVRFLYIYGQQASGGALRVLYQMEGSAWLPGGWDPTLGSTTLYGLFPFTGVGVVRVPIYGRGRRFRFRIQFADDAVKAGIEALEIGYSVQGKTD